jgi:hypothetical protein
MLPLDGQTVLTLTPLEFLDRLAVLARPCRHHHRCRGILTPPNGPQRNLTVQPSLDVIVAGATHELGNPVSPCVCCEGSLPRNGGMRKRWQPPAPQGGRSLYRAIDSRVLSKTLLSSPAMTLRPMLRLAPPPNPVT